MKIILLECVLITLIIWFLIIISYQFYPTSVFATAPSFSRYEIKDTPDDWMDMRDTNNTKPAGKDYTDIQSVSYFTNDKVLDATIWLASFEEVPSGGKEKVSYGMYIDADFNNQTGVQGIDYQVELSWENKTMDKTTGWTRVFKEWSSNGGEKVIGNITTNLTGFFGKGEGFGYVDLSADLPTMHSPNQYKVVFYAEEENEETGMDWVMDSTNWIPIPTPKLDILTSPTSIVLRPEEEGFIQIFINSTANSNLKVHLSQFPEKTEDVLLDFNPKELDIASFGKATSNLHINVLAYAENKPNTIFVLLNAKVPAEQFATSTSSEIANADVALPPPSLVPVSLQEENIVKHSSFSIRIERPLTVEEHFRNFWTNFGEFITFAGGIATGTIIPRLFKEKR